MDNGELLMQQLKEEYRQDYLEWLKAQPDISNCLLWSRAEELAQDRSSITEEEIAHMQSCGYCKKLVEKLATQRIENNFMLRGAILRDSTA